MPYYVTNDQLRQQVTDSQAAGKFTPELVTSLSLIVTNTMKKWRGGNVLPSDVLADVYIALAPRLYKIRLDTNLFSFFTTVTLNALRQQKNQEARYHEKTQRIINQAKMSSKTRKRFS